MGIDREGRLLADANLADIGLVDFRFDLHLMKVAGDNEQGLGFKARRERLPLIDVAADDNAVDRRADGGAIQVDLRDIQ